MAGRSLAVQELHNDKATATLLFIHGACSSGSEWELVTPHLLSDYHILLPDLPHHGASAEIVPFSVELAVELLAEVIRTNAIGGKVHLIGLSLGARVAAALASAHPHLIHTVFISGYSTFSSTNPESLAKGLWLQSRIESCIPRCWMRRAMDGTDFQSSLPKPSLQLYREIAAPNMHGEQSELKPWPARTLIVAAGKKDWLPTAGNLDDARGLRDSLIKAQNGRTKAVTHAEMRHPWNRQRPDVFAEAVRAWNEEGRVVEGFDEL